MDVPLQCSRSGPGFCLLTACLLHSFVLFADPLLPPPFTAHFSGSKYLIFHLDSLIRLQHIGRYLKYTFNTEGTTLFYSTQVYDCSVMRIASQSLLPLEHKHTDVRNPRFDAYTVFNWKERVAHVKTDYGGKSGDYKIDPPQPVWDPISLQIRIMIDAMSGQLSKPRSYKLLEYRKPSTWPTAIQGQETLETDHGNINTVIVQRTDGKSFKLWLAKDFGFIPVMVELDSARVSLTQDPGAITQDAQLLTEGQPHC